jgi:hypothetical protein
VKKKENVLKWMMTAKSMCVCFRQDVCENQHVKQLMSNHGLRFLTNRPFQCFAKFKSLMKRRFANVLFVRPPIAFEENFMFSKYSFHAHKHFLSLILIFVQDGQKNTKLFVTLQRKNKQSQLADHLTANMKQLFTYMQTTFSDSAKETE